MLHVIDLDGPTPLSLKVDNPRAGNIEWIDNRRFLVAQQPSTINTTVDKRCSQEWGEGGTVLTVWRIRSAVHPSASDPRRTGGSRAQAKRDTGLRLYCRRFR